MIICIFVSKVCCTYYFKFMDALYFLFSLVYFLISAVVFFTLMSIPIVMVMTICHCFTLKKSENIKVAHYESLESEHTEAISQNPDDYDAYYRRAEARTALGDKVGALADYTQCLRIAPEAPNMEVYYNRAVLFISLFYFFEWLGDTSKIVLIIFSSLFEELIGSWLKLIR